MNKLLEKLFNPAMGVLPLLVFVVLQSLVPYNTALMIGIIIYVVAMLITFPVFKVAPPNMLITSGVVFCIYLFLIRLTPLRKADLLYTPVILEVVFLIVIGFILLFRSYIKCTAASETDKRKENVVRVTCLNEYFHVLVLFKNVLSFHLLIVVLYQVLPDQYKKAYLDHFIFYFLSIILVLMVIIYESIRLQMLNKKISSEEWLPVVDESGKVLGRIAFCVSSTSKKHYLHPMVRIALIHKGLFYLVGRPSYFIIDPNKIDYPFEQHVIFQQSIDDAVKSLLTTVAGRDDLNAKFVFRYLFKNNTASRLIYLFNINIQSEEVMQSLKLQGGKLWTEKQIEENLGIGVFSECFEKEYEILKNTVLMAEKLANGQLNEKSASN